MKKIFTLLCLFMLSGTYLLSQNQTNMYYRGEMNSWGSTSMTYRPLGTPSWATTIQSDGNDTKSNFKFANTTDWSDKDWSNGGTATLNSLTTFYEPNGGNSNFNETNTYYYTFTIKDVSSGNSEGFVMKTSALPVTIDAVTQLPLTANVSDNDDVAISVTTSAAPCAEEHIYIRYSTDNWISSAIVEASFSGTSGSATIPAQSAETTVSYYIFSTTISSPTSDYDLMTINYNNNGGPNYSYTVKYGTVAAGQWNNTSTWRAGTVPASNNNVIVNDNVTVSNSISSPAECNDLIINSGTLTINENDALTVHGTLTNNGTAANLVIASDATGNGSLIVNGSVTGNATVQRYIAAFSAPSAADGWHEIGCPVTSFTVSGTDWDPTATGSNNDLYYWDESQNLWMNYRTATFDFSPDQGYLTANDADLTHSFTGTLNNADVTASSLTFTSGKGEGWHLLGNPFPCAIKWNDDNWTLTNVAGTAKIWDYSNNPGNYTDVSANGIIPSTNGFLVEVSSGTTGSVTIPTAARLHNNANNYKNEEANSGNEKLIIRISNNQNEFTDINTIGFNAEATNKMDLAYDSHKLFGDAQAPQLWTVSDDEMFSTNYLPYSSDNIDVPLSFKAGVNGTYFINFEGLSSFYVTSNINFEDLLTGTTFNLKNQNSYEFIASTEDATNRFVLHFYNVTSTPETEQANNRALIYTDNLNHIVVKANDKVLNGTIEIMDLLGQTIDIKTVSNSNFFTLNTNFNEGVYIVRYTGKSGYIQTQKVVLQ